MVAHKNTAKTRGVHGMRVLFVVQGEGRGHMTQAISLKQVLENEGHEVCAVCVGRSRERAVPQFFLEKMDSPVICYDSPNFKTDRARRGISIAGTAFENLKRLHSFARSLKILHRTVRSCRPDLIINFFDPLAAIYGAMCPSKPKMVCVAHQYLLLHPGFVFPKLNTAARLAMLAFIRLCAMGADRLLALSFRKMPDFQEKRLIVVPPLLRMELREKRPVTEDFILAYVLNEGYAYDLAVQQRRRPDVQIVGFWDRKGAAEETELQRNLVFRPLNDVAFLDAMSRCRGLMTTAGFESVCEAMYLGKPVYMMPAGRQIEQLCNAVDATLSGAGIWGFDFDLDRFLKYLPRHRSRTETFRAWVDSGEKIYPSLLGEAGS
jgi:uncharacterized protein (TIGR00661 family)